MTENSTASGSTDGSTQQVSLPTFTSNAPPLGRPELKEKLSDKWKKWDVWDAYETVTKLNEKESKFRVATFITCIGAEALEVHKGLLFRSGDERQDINVVLNLWNSHCIGHINIYERYRFNNRKQESRESIDVYATALRALAATCEFEFGALKDEMIRDRLVCGITENSVRRKLLQEPKLSLEKCLDICRSAEATSAHLKVISGQSISTGKPADTLNTLDKRRKSKAPPKRRSKGPKQPVPEPKEDLLKCCKHCGRSHIKQRFQCPAFGKVCSACNKPNHFAEVCKSAPGRNSRPRNGVNMIDADSSSEEELLSITFDSTEGSVHMVNEENLLEKRIFATMEIAGKSVRMQIDTGASCNVLPQKFVPSGTNIIQSDRTLKMYSKSTMPVLGTCRVRMRNPKNNKKYNAEFVVVKGN